MIHRTANGQRRPRQQTENKTKNTHKTTQNAVHLQSPPVSVFVNFSILFVHICFSIVFLIFHRCFVVRFCGWYVTLKRLSICTLHTSFTIINPFPKGFVFIASYVIFPFFFFNSEKNKNNNEHFYILSLNGANDDKILNSLHMKCD